MRQEPATRRIDEAPTLTPVLARSRLSKTVVFVTAALLLLVAIAIVGSDIVFHVNRLEAWILNLGPWGILAFVAVYVLATSLMVPESVLSIAAGALFGLAYGLVAVVVGSLLAAALQYALSHRLLRRRIAHVVASRPSLAAVQQVVSGNQLRLQVLLRLTPLNPATVSYLLGAAGVRFAGFLAASLAVFPHLLFEVYFGFAGKRVARLAGHEVGASFLHDVLVVVGLVVTVVVIILVSHLARRALVMAVSDATKTDATS